MVAFNVRSKYKYPNKHEGQLFRKILTDNLFATLVKVSFGEYEYVYDFQIVIQLEENDVGMHRAKCYMPDFRDPVDGEALKPQLIDITCWVGNDRNATDFTLYLIDHIRKVEDAIRRADILREVPASVQPEPDAEVEE